MLTDEVLNLLISRYTREAGVRQLEQMLGRLTRKVALTFADLPDGQERRLVKVLIALDERFESWGTRVAELRLTDRWSWSLRLESDLRVEFGRREPVEVISSLLALLPLLGKERMALLQSIDLRYPYGFAVVWKTYPPDVEAPLEQLGGKPPA